jgi:formylglycine-generating enzyme required for sulfatase activity
MPVYMRFICCIIVAALAACAEPAADPPADEFVWIEGGTFMMGSPPTDDNRQDDEAPYEGVTVSGFYMGRHEVTQAEWVKVMEDNPSEFQGERLPVEQISWYDAIDYCIKRSIQEGLTPAYTRDGNVVTWDRGANGYRLPTEAEWEYACRAGTATPYWTGETITVEQANYDNELKAARNVGSYAPNPWGLYDMHGNVEEWCWDWYGLSYGSGPKIDPPGPELGDYRVSRGGGWFYSAVYVRSAVRESSYLHKPDETSSYLGFRLVHR